MPTVSVIVPAWNSERTLLATLQSVARQTHRNLEILIIDDGSTDNTAAVAAQFCASEPRARLFRKDNGGVASARNYGIDASRGEWIAPIDADDVWHPTKIQKQVAVARQAPERIGFVYCWYRPIDEEGRVLSSGPRLALSGRIFSQLAYMNPVENGSAPLVLRRALFEVGGYNQGFPPYEDVLLQLQIAARYDVAVVREHLVGWRRHASNASSDVDLISLRARHMYAQLSSDGAPVPRPVGRWVAALNAFYSAEQRAIAGQAAGALVSLTRALWLDPVRTGMLLAYRTVRTLHRRSTGWRGSGVRPFFDDVDPAAVLPTDAFAIPRLAAVLETVDRARLERLAKIDLKTAASGSGPRKRPAELRATPVSHSHARQRKAR